MSANLPQPKCRIEIFREPGFFDDNFAKGWTAVSGSYITSGDDVKVYGAANGAGRIEKSLNNLNTNTYTRIQVRISAIYNGAWGIKVYDGSTWNTVWTGQTTIGLFQTTFPLGKMLTKIALLQENAGTENYVCFDYVAICKNPLLTPVTENLIFADAIESLEITLPILSRGLAGAKFKLPNFDGQYTGKVKEHDIVLIWLYRTDETFTKVFGGRVSKVTYEGIAGGPQYYIYVECMDHGWELQVPPALVQKAYTNTNGKTIIKDAVAVCNYVSDYGVDQSNAIASTHSYVFDEKTPWNVIREVADACQTSGGAVGFDGYVDAAGNLRIFPRGANNSTVDLTDKIIRYKVEYDTYRVKNKIKVYGKATKTIPANRDDWSDSTTNWTGDNITAYANDKVLGNYSIFFWSTGTSAYAQRTIPTINCLFPHQPRTFNFSITGHYCPYLTNLKIILLAPNISNYFFQNKKYTNPNPYFPWEHLSFKLGPTEEGSGDDNKWGKVGSPSWSNIQGLRFELTFSSGSTGGQGVDIDAIYFGEAAYSATAEDSTSQSLYGVRMPEPTVDDSLQSDDDCAKKAQSLLAYYKDKVTTLTVETFGNNAFKPGDMQNITLNNDNISGSFRILEITHTLQDVFWKTDLLMSNEPIMIDYIFRSMFQKQKQFETNI